MTKAQVLAVLMSHVESARQAMRDDLAAEPNPDRDEQTTTERKAYAEGFYTGMGLALGQLVEEFGGTAQQADSAHYLAAFEVAA